MYNNKHSSLHQRRTRAIHAHLPPIDWSIHESVLEALVSSERHQLLLIAKQPHHIYLQYRRYL